MEADLHQTPESTREYHQCTSIYVCVSSAKLKKRKEKSYTQWLGGSGEMNYEPWY